MTSLLDQVFSRNKEKRQRDIREIRAMFKKYGDETLDVLQQRASDRRLNARNRRHWRRLSGQAKQELRSMR